MSEAHAPIAEHIHYDTHYCHGCKQEHELRRREWVRVIGKNERAKMYCRPQWEVRRKRLVRAINMQVAQLRAIFAEEAIPA